MARLPRFVIPGQPQHVIVRGNNRTPIFYTEEDYRFYLKKLKQAWVLGSSHFKEQIEQQLNHRAQPAAKGGDRKSAAYQEKVRINRV